MEGDNVEQLWYGICLIKAGITLFVVSLVVLFCHRFLRTIFCNRAERRPPKHPKVHPHGTVQPTPKAADLDPDDIKRRIG